MPSVRQLSLLGPALRGVLVASAVGDAAELTPAMERALVLERGGPLGLGLTFAVIVDRLIALPDGRGVQGSFLVDDEGRVVVRSGEGARAVAAAASDDGRVPTSPLPWGDVAAAARAHKSGAVEHDGSV